MLTFSRKKVLILCNQSRILFRTRFELIEALLDRGWTVKISAPDSRYSEPFVRAGAEMIDTPLDRRGLTPFADYRLYGAYKKILREERPDLVLAFTVKPNVYGVRAAVKLGIPVIPTITGLGTSIQNRGPLQSFVFGLYRRGFRTLTAVFFQNYANAELFRLLGMVRREQIIRVPGSGVNLEENGFQPYPGAEKPVRFLFIGRLMGEKGILDYLAAARRIRPEFPEVGFGVLGYSEEPEILAQVQSLAEVGVIDYYGYEEDVRPFIAESHAVVLPSWHEGMANVLLEAAAAGRPVIASDISGCGETFNEGQTGFGFRPADTDSLCAALKRFLALPHEERAAMGAAGRKKMEFEFDRRKVTETYLTEIDRALG